MHFLGVAALQALNDDENSSVQRLDDLKSKIQEALGVTSKLPSNEVLQLEKSKFNILQPMEILQWHTLAVSQSHDC